MQTQQFLNKHGARIGIGDAQASYVSLMDFEKLLQEAGVEEDALPAKKRRNGRAVAHMLCNDEFA